MAGRLPEPAGRRVPEPRRGGVPWGWVAVGAVGALGVVLVIQTVLAVIFGLFRLALIGAAVAAIAWLVIIGPPSRKR
jgi:hypothetical protein